MRAGPARIQSKLGVGGACLLAALIATPGVMAQEPLPNQSCAGFAAGTFRQSGGPEISGGHMLVCDGTNWRSVMSYDNNARLTKLGNQTCGEGDILQFSSAIWQCEDSDSLGDSLWELSDETVLMTTTAGLQWGSDITASGLWSTAWGFESIASAQTSTAWGNGSSASESNSTAFGNGTAASGAASTAWGNNTTASGNYSTAWGYNGSTASGQSSTAWGGWNEASGDNSTAWGGSGVASGGVSTAWGFGSHAGSYLETSFGRYPLNTAGTAGSWVATDTLFEIGNGTSPAARANAVTVLKNGKLGLGDASPDGNLLLDVEGQVGATAYCDEDGGSCFTASEIGGGSSLWTEASGILRPVSASPKVVWGFDSTANAEGATAWGTYSIASGDYSTASGFGNIASGLTAMTWGMGDLDGDGPNTASGGGSTAFGKNTIASGILSTAWGLGSTASGAYSSASGLGSHAGSYAETSLGRYPLNTAGTAGSWVATDTLFEIGNGASSGARANAVTVLKNGNVGVGTADPQSALHIPDGKYLQIEDNNAGAPPQADCDNDSERGRVSIDTQNARLYVCMGGVASGRWGYIDFTAVQPPPI